MCQRLPPRHAPLRSYQEKKCALRRRERSSITPHRSVRGRKTPAINFPGARQLADNGASEHERCRPWTCTVTRLLRAHSSYSCRSTGTPLSQSSLTISPRFYTHAPLASGVTRARRCAGWHRPKRRHAASATMAHRRACAAAVSRVMSGLLLGAASLGRALVVRGTSRGIAGVASFLRQCRCVLLLLLRPHFFYRAARCGRVGQGALTSHPRS